MLKTFITIFEVFTKLAPVPALSLSIASGVTLFAKDSFLKTIGIITFKEQNQGIIAGVFIFSSAYIVASIIWWVWNIVSKRIAHRLLNNMRIQYLLELTPKELSYLKPFIESNVATEKYLITDGIASNLVSKQILYLANNLGTYYEGHEFAIQPWAKKYLKSHPELLKNAEEIEN